MICRYTPLSVSRIKISRRNAAYSHDPLYTGVQKDDQGSRAFLTAVCFSVSEAATGEPQQRQQHFTRISNPACSVMISSCTRCFIPLLYRNAFLIIQHTAVQQCMDMIQIHTVAAMAVEKVAESSAHTFGSCPSCEKIPLTVMTKP